MLTNMLKSTKISQMQKKKSNGPLIPRRRLPRRCNSITMRRSTLKTKPYSAKFKCRHTTCCKTELRNASKKIGEIGIPGVQKIFGPENGKCRKVFWSIALIGCAMICFYQLQDRLIYYFQYHITNDVTTRIVEGASFPGITVCPVRAPFKNTSKYYDLVNKKCQRSTEPNCMNKNFTFEDFDTSLEDIWSETGIKKEAVHVVTSCVVLDNSNCDENGIVTVNMTTTLLNTFWGSCLTLYTEEPLLYKGPANTYLDIEFNDSLLYDEQYGSGKSLVQVYFHPIDIKQRHEAYLYAEYIYKESFTTIRVTGKEFYDFIICVALAVGTAAFFISQIFNYIRSNCGSNVDVTECRNACVDKMLDITVACKLPFMTSSNLLPCNTINAAKEAYNKAEKYYRTMNVSKCPCPKKCSTTVFISEIDTKGNGFNTQTVLTVFKTENRNEIITESWSYTFPSLLSDIGGTLGFFMGMCMLNLLEIVEIIMQKLTCNRVCCSRVTQYSRNKKVRKKVLFKKSPSNPHCQSADITNEVTAAYDSSVSFPHFHGFDLIREI